MNGTRRLSVGLWLAVLLCAGQSAVGETNPPADASVSAAQLAEKAAQLSSKAASMAAADASSAAMTAAAAATEAQKSAKNSWEPPVTLVLYGVPAVVVLTFLFSLLKVSGYLKAHQTWSLATALSEEVNLPAPAISNGPPPAIIPDAPMVTNGQVVLMPTMQASSSRLIALLGCMAILFLYVGFGLFAVFEFGATGKVPDTMDGVVKYLTAGLTLFAPYAVNKITSAVKPS